MPETRGSVTAAAAAAKKAGNIAHALFLLAIARKMPKGK
jgi:hypothetical protein